MLEIGSKTGLVATFYRKVAPRPSCQGKTLDPLTAGEEMPKTYFDGMIAAYRDAAQFVEHLQKNLPPEVAFMAPAFEPLIQGFNNKANEVIKQFVWGDFPERKPEV